jgi:hypothetical protein
MRKTNPISGLIILALLSTKLLVAQAPVAADGLGNIWAVRGNAVFKYSSNGTPIYEYSNRELGPPSSIDAGDPFRVLLFSKPNQRAAVISSDATLLGNVFNFGNSPYGEILILCRSSQGGIWAYSSSTKQLIHFNNFFAPTGQRVNVLRLGFKTEPTHIVDADGIIYLAFDGKYIARITSYGKSLTSFAINHHGVFSVQKKELWITQNGIILRYSIVNANPIFPSLECDCNSPPIIAGSDTTCFDGRQFFPCQKVDFFP